MSDDSQGRHGNHPQGQASLSSDKPDHRAAYIGLAVTVLPFLVAAIRVYVIANGDLSIIKSLGATLNIQSLLLGTYLGVLPTLLFAGAISLAFHALLAIDLGTVTLWRRAGFAISLAAISAMLFDVHQARTVALYVLIFVVNVLASDATGRLMRRRMFAKALLPQKKRPLLGISGATATKMGYKPSEENLKRTQIALTISRRVGFSLQGILVITLLVQVLFAPGMWLPTESIGVRSQRTAIIGFVLEEKDDQIIVLRRDGLGIQRFQNEDIVNRQLCNDVAEKEPAFVKLFGRSIKTDRIPVCKEQE
ncbi:hypothetical protein AB0M91_27430 [Micromonospora rifamycinica]|uniref:hypothetical protein n=1 Tax=Micromonospora rifamycinica TaxID=291594 RepID=UPI00343204D8